MQMVMTRVPVSDRVKAFGFYSEALGVTERLSLPAAQLAIVVSPEDPNGVGLLLEPDEHPAYRAFQEAIYAEGLPCIAFGTSDIRAEYDRLTARGVTFCQEPTQTGAGLLAVFDDTF